MRGDVRKILRSVQVFVPALQDYRFAVQRTFRKTFQIPHEEDFHILAHLPPSENKLFIDIGANRGDAIQSILMMRPDARVLAFEPNPILINKTKRLYAHDERVEIRNLGLGDRTMAFSLHIPFYNDYMFDGLASFKEENARDWLRLRLYGFRTRNLRIRKIDCEVRRLDDFNLTPFFIKIDVQGFEYEVLRGGERTIADARPILLIETPGTKELDFLADMNYRPFIFRKNKLWAGTHRCNVFFLPAESICEIQAKARLFSEREVQLQAPA